MRRFGFSLAVALLCASNVVAQLSPPGPGGPGGGPGGPGGPGAALNVSIATNAANVPIGTTVSLTANHDPVTDPTYSWEAACVTDISIFPWFTQTNWNTKTIADCVGRDTSPTLQDLQWTSFMYSRLRLREWFG